MEILYRCYSYAPGYDVLEKNWEYICSTLNTTKKEIWIVEEFGDTEELESKTKEGYVIRLVRDLVPCIRCNRAMLSRVAHEYITGRYTNTDKVPPICSKWNEKCIECRSW